MATDLESAIQAPSNVLELLASLHEQSLQQEKHLADSGDYDQIRKALRSGSAGSADDIMRDKFIALTADKTSFMYQLIRAKGALNVLEAGTSFGVSTIYLGLAVGQNAAAAGKAPDEAKVIATEYEPSKAQKAREHWRAAGSHVEPWIELREGDLRETLKDNLPKIDFVLLDIWTPMVLPTIKLVEPKLRPGAVILADNTIASHRGYAEYLEYIRQPQSGYRTMTLPFPEGLEMTLFLGK
ncbi:MAG: hypothetical protein M1821_002322 [Bathelium mastoideum]|nr:MAG: hypothetical protein M1821_002322 [Bathelium mastoideum]